MGEAAERGRVDVTQESLDGIALLKGADVDFQVLAVAPCEECGGLVALTRILTVRTLDVDSGVETEEEMTEANARQLLAVAGIPPPPVMCDRHDERFAITTEVKRG